MYEVHEDDNNYPWMASGMYTSRKELLNDLYGKNVDTIYRYELSGDLARLIGLDTDQEKAFLVAQVWWVRENLI